jgi:hypothetical protein
MWPANIGRVTCGGHSEPWEGERSWSIFQRGLNKAIRGTSAVMKGLVFARLLMLKLDLKCF